LILSYIELSDLYEGKYSGIELFRNQYLVIRDKNNKQVDEGRWDGKRFVKLQFKPISNQLFGKFEPKNQEQRFSFDLLQNESITGKVLLGGFGSGKTMMSLVHALQFILSTRNQKFDRLIYLRNNIIVKNTESVGFLPNDLTCKIKPYAMALADILGEESSLDALIYNHKIILESLSFIRGRNYKNSVVLVSESQNLTTEHLALIMSRISDGSILIVEGDYTQRDKSVFEKSNGLEIMVDKLKGDMEFGVVTLKQNLRSRFASLSDKLIVD
jgi:PhoH-like ATPase